MKELTYEEVAKSLKDNDLYGEINQPLFNSKYMANAVFDITISGDWKHDHGFLVYLMKERGYCETRNDIVHDEYDDGGDFYTSTHRFVYKPYYELINGKAE